MAQEFHPFKIYRIDDYRQPSTIEDHMVAMTAQIPIEDDDYEINRQIQYLNHISQSSGNQEGRLITTTTFIIMNMFI